MSSTDRISGNYNLKTLNGDINLIANSGIGTTTIYGNLVVIGTQSSIQSIDTLISDNIITLSAGVINGQPVLNAGIEVKRGDEPTVAFRWTESVKRWQLTNDGSYYGNIMVRVQDDPDPHLGGNLYVNGYDIRSEYGKNIVLRPGYNPNQTLGFSSTDYDLYCFDAENEDNGGVQLSIICGVVEAVPGYITFYARSPLGGGSGMYVANDLHNAEELITTRRALVFSLVL